MKRTYETMEAYKVSFNAREQVAAAACDIAEIGSKYGGIGTGVCSVQMGTSDKFAFNNASPCEPKTTSYTIEYASAAG